MSTACVFINNFSKIGSKLALILGIGILLSLKWWLCVCDNICDRIDSIDVVKKKYRENQQTTTVYYFVVKTNNKIINEIYIFHLKIRNSIDKWKSLITSTLIIIKFPISNNKIIFVFWKFSQNKPIEWHWRKSSSLIKNKNYEWFHSNLKKNWIIISIIIIICQTTTTTNVNYIWKHSLFLWSKLSSLLLLLLLIN